MARLGDGVDVRASVVSAATGWYDRQREAQGKVVPEAFRDCNPKVIRVALRMAGRDWRRLEVADDGGIIVHDRPVWT